MSTAAVDRPRRINKLATAAENKFVDDLMRISQPVFDKMTPAEQERRLKKLNEYLDSLGARAAKRA